MCDFFALPQTTAFYRNCGMRKVPATTAFTAFLYKNAVCGAVLRQRVEVG